MGSTIHHKCIFKAHKANILKEVSIIEVATLRDELLFRDPKDPKNFVLSCTDALELYV